MDTQDTPNTSNPQASGDAQSPAVRAPAAGTPLHNTFPCKSCGAKLVFEPGAHALTCRFCGAVNEFDAKTEVIEELDFKAHLHEMQGSQETEDRIVVHCDACGADLPMKPNVTSQNCDFCGTPIVATGHTRKLIRPRSLLPFHITDKQAREMFQTWLSARWFAPRDLKRAAAVDGRLAGCDLPYGTYDADANTPYTGQRGDDYWTTETYSVTVNGRSQMRTRQVRRTRWTSVSGQVFSHFDDVLVPASASVPGEMLSKLNEWDLQNLTPYDDRFLSGFRAESYTIDLPEGFSRAITIMVEWIKRTIEADIGGDHQQITSMHPQYSAITFKHVLLPIWIAAYRYRGKSYRFIVNARSGQVVGDRPYSWIKITLAVLAGLIVIGVIALFIANSR
ncbi:MAG: hypothetical protein K2X32_08745 [Phycisphaerales bacterium]|nr:hypothetical protein [Phycisphaerales bacterium]